MNIHVDPIIEMENTIKTTLSNYLKNNQNIELLTESIINKCENINIKWKHLLHNCVGILIKSTTQDAYEYIEQLTNSNDLYNCNEFEIAIRLCNEETDYIQKPITVEEGVNVCNKCGSKKTISYSKQTRSADEGTTVFCMCVNCNAKWKM